MAWIKLSNINESIMNVSGDKDTMYALRDYFTITVNGYRYNPKYKMGLWDGKIRVLKFVGVDMDTIHATLPKGLIAKIVKLSRNMNFTLAIDKNMKFTKDTRDMDDYIQWLNLPYKIRYYQGDILEKSFQFPRRVFLSPTASGKSFAQYMIARRFNKVLLIVPSINLLNQMYSSFIEFSEKNHVNIARMSSKSKEDWENADIVISTWQTAIKKSSLFLNQFDCIIGDECHRFKAKSLITIMDRANEVHYRYGFTGTIDDTRIDKIVLEGIFGPIVKVTSTTELIEKGFISELVVNMEVLQHPYSEWSKYKKGNESVLKYQDEMTYISHNDVRNWRIVNDVKEFSGVTLILTKYIDHAKCLYEMLDHDNKYLIYGDIDGDRREQLRLEIREKKDAVVVATYGTMSTGVDIPNIRNLVMAMPLKSKITLLQSIGRGLRLHADKENLNVYDYSDVFLGKNGKPLKNHGHNHMIIRYQIYMKENFEVNVRERDIYEQ